MRNITIILLFLSHASLGWSFCDKPGSWKKTTWQGKNIYKCFMLICEPSGQNQVEIYHKSKRLTINSVQGTNPFAKGKVDYICAGACTSCR